MWHTCSFQVNVRQSVQMIIWRCGANKIRIRCFGLRLLQHSFHLNNVNFVAQPQRNVEAFCPQHKQLALCFTTDWAFFRRFHAVACSPFVRTSFYVFHPKSDCVFKSDCFECSWFRSASWCDGFHCVSFWYCNSKCFLKPITFWYCIKSVPQCAHSSSNVEHYKKSIQWSISKCIRQRI